MRAFHTTVQCFAHLHFHMRLEVTFGMEPEFVSSQDGSVPVKLLPKTYLPSDEYFIKCLSPPSFLTCCSSQCVMVW